MVHPKIPLLIMDACALITAALPPRLLNKVINGSYFSRIRRVARRCCAKRPLISSATPSGHNFGSKFSNICSITLSVDVVESNLARINITLSLASLIILANL